MAAMDVVIAPRTGFRLKNPVIAASGTFGYGVEFASRMDVSGIGAIVCKGTTREARAGNPPVRLTETPAGMLNSIGLQNIGVEAVASDMAPQWAALGTPVLVNVAGSSVDDYRFIVERLEGVEGIAGIELNISCPNVKEGGIQFGADPESAAEVTRAARRTTRAPLIVKLSPNVSDIQTIAHAVEDAGADAVSVSNTLYGMAIDARRRQPVLANVTGGLSGPAIKPYALYLVHQVSQAVSIPIIGIGGIMTGLDAIEFLLAGATAVQLGTALMIDPTSWRKVITEINAWMNREGVSDLAEVIGAANAGFKRKAGERSLAG
jgi:dihydroorotate dehydrogenase (NAD+) catalytic subunit